MLERATRPFIGNTRPMCNIIDHLLKKKVLLLLLLKKWDTSYDSVRKRKMRKQVMTMSEKIKKLSK